MLRDKHQRADFQASSWEPAEIVEWRRRILWHAPDYIHTDKTGGESAGTFSTHASTQYPPKN